MLREEKIAHYFSKPCVRMADYKGLSAALCCTIAIRIE